MAYATVRTEPSLQADLASEPRHRTLPPRRRRRRAKSVTRIRHIICENYNLEPEGMEAKDRPVHRSPDLCLGDDVKSTPHVIVFHDGGWANAVLLNGLRAKYPRLKALNLSKTHEHDEVFRAWISPSHVDQTELCDTFPMFAPCQTLIIATCPLRGRLVELIRHLDNRGLSSLLLWVRGPHTEHYGVAEFKQVYATPTWKVSHEMVILAAEMWQELQRELTTWDGALGVSELQKFTTHYHSPAMKRLMEWSTSHNKWLIAPHKLFPGQLSQMTPATQTLLQDFYERCDDNAHAFNTYRELVLGLVEWNSTQAQNLTQFMAYRHEHKIQPCLALDKVKFLAQPADPHSQYRPHQLCQPIHALWPLLFLQLHAHCTYQQSDYMWPLPKTQKRSHVGCVHYPTIHWNPHTVQQTLQEIRQQTMWK